VSFEVTQVVLKKVLVLVLLMTKWAVESIRNRKKVVNVLFANIATTANQSYRVFVDLIAMFEFQLFFYDHVVVVCYLFFFLI
jgi:hypothetical protein